MPVRTQPGGTDPGGRWVLTAVDHGTVTAGFLGRVERLVRVPAPTPRWDDDTWLADPAPDAAWPAPAELRISSRQPIYSLERASVAGLGFEGDLLLGWRGGDAIASDLG